MSRSSRLWFQEFLIEPDDRSEDTIVWAEQQATPVTERKPATEQRRALLMIGAVAIAFNVLLIILFIVAVYLSRR